MFKINGVDVTSGGTTIIPKSLTVTINDIDSDKTTRNAKGSMKRDRIAVKRTISLVFPPLTNAQMSALLTAIQGVTFTCTYPDPLVGGLVSPAKTFYVGNRTAPMFSYTTGMWESCSMDFIEV